MGNGLQQSLGYKGNIKNLNITFCFKTDFEPQKVLFNESHKKSLACMMILYSLETPFLIRNRSSKIENDYI
jgi:hypothetical protein